LQVALFYCTSCFRKVKFKRRPCQPFICSTDEFSSSKHLIHLILSTEFTRYLTMCFSYNKLNNNIFHNSLSAKREKKVEKNFQFLSFHLYIREDFPNPLICLPWLGRLREHEAAVATSPNHSVAVVVTSV